MDKIACQRSMERAAISIHLVNKHRLLRSGLTMRVALHALLAMAVCLALVLPRPVLADEPSASAAVPQSSESPMRINTDAFEFTAIADGENPASQSLVISTAGDPFSWEAETETLDGGNWLSLSTSSGAINVATATVDVMVDTSGLTEGFYFGYIYMVDVNALDEIEISVFLEVMDGEESILSVNPGVLRFETVEGGASPAAQVVTIGNEGSLPFSWQAINESGPVSPTVNPSAGVLASNSMTVEVQVDTTGLPSGIYHTSIDFVDEETFYYETVVVEVLVAGEVDASVNPNALSLKVIEGDTKPISETLTISGGGPNGLSWYAYNEEAWLSLAYDEHDESKLFVSASGEELITGSYTDTITLVTTGGIRTVPVEVDVKPARLVLDSTPLPNLTAQLSFDPPNPAPGEPVIVIVNVTNDGDAAIVNQPFYVDFYINPETQPNAGYDWMGIGSKLAPARGIEWAVENVSLAPGANLTLRSDGTGGIGVFDGYTAWDGMLPNGTTEVYVLVDSWAPASSPNGSILEKNEADNLVRRAFSVQNQYAAEAANGSGSASYEADKVVGQTSVAQFQSPTQDATVELFGLEVTQSIQNLKNDVRLIAGKPTFVRAHVRSSNGTVTNQQAQLIGTRDGAELPDSPLSPVNPNGRIDVLQTPSRAQLNDSFIFELPESWRSGTVTFEFRGVGNNYGCKEIASEANDCKATVVYADAYVPTIRLFTVTWNNGDELKQPSEAEFQQAKEEILANMPVASVNWETAPTPIHFDGWAAKDGFGRLLELVKRLEAISQQDNPEAKIYYGLATGWETGTIGLASLASLNTNKIVGGSSGSLARTVGHNTAAHEVGHIFISEHVACTGTEIAPDTSYPYSNGRISGNEKSVDDPDAFYGFDIFTRRILPPNTGDLMGYCSPAWVSKYQYDRYYDAIKGKWNIGVGASRPTEIRVDEPQIWVSGEIMSNGNSGSLDSILDLGIDTTHLPAIGDYSLRMEDESGQELASYPFAPEGFSDGPQGTTTFSLVLPKPANLAKIVLLRNAIVLDERRASTNAPVVELTSPNGGESLSGDVTISWTGSDGDGDSLTYFLDYSQDNGSTWYPIVANYLSNSYKVNVAALPGSGQGLIRVRANDGFLTTDDQSDSFFSVPNSAPLVVISNQNGEQYVGDQNITLEGSAFDYENGELEGSSLSWASTHDGQLGTGDTLVLSAHSLKVGKHTITLTARDADGATSSASFTLEVGRVPDILPTALALYPGAIGAGLNVDKGETETFAIGIANDGDDNLGWTATTAQSWLKLDATSGNGAATVNVTMDGTGLLPGEYKGEIKVTEQRSGQTQTVYASLFVQGNGKSEVYFPTVFK